MNFGNRRSPLPAGLILLGAMLLLQLCPAFAQSARVVARITPEPGRIADIAALPDGHLYLLYPDAGRITDYTLDGELHQHIVREGGSARLFTPMACTVSPGNELLVFDEAAHKVFFISTDGNILRGVDLAYQTPEGPVLALSRVGDLSVGASNIIWATLPADGVLAGFDYQGSHAVSLDLVNLLPYSPANYTRGQVLADGSLFVLDYHQGAVIYRRGPQGQFRRIMLSRPAGLTAAPTVQDFAVDDAGNVLVATHDPAAPLVLLTPGADGYQSHAVDLGFADGVPRLACRWSGGMFIVWTRDTPNVIILELGS